MECINSLSKRRGGWSILAPIVFLSYMDISSLVDIHDFTTDTLPNYTGIAEKSTNEGDPFSLSTESTEVPVSMTTSFNTPNYTDTFPTDTMSSIIDDVINVTSTQTKSFTGQYSDYAGKITLPIAMLLGGIGNSITMATMSTLPFRAMTWSIILMSLAVADTLVLLAVPFNKPFIIDLIGKDVPSINSVTCKIYHFIRRTTKMVSAWLIVLVCFERFIAVCFPMKVKQICTKTRTAIGIVCVVSLSAIYCSLWVTTAGVVNGICLQTVMTRETRSKAMMFIILGSVFIVVLPIAIMLVLTPITCFVLRRHQQLRTQISTANQQSDTYMKATAMLISLCVGYVVLLTPAMVSYNLAFYRKESLLTTKDTTLIIIREVSQVMELINYSSNFFLYTAFNDIFRKRVMNCLTCNTRPLSATTTSVSQSYQMSVVEPSQTTKELQASGSVCEDDRDCVENGVDLG